MLRKRVVLLVVACCCLLVLAPSALYSQASGTGTVAGLVTDPSGGASSVPRSLLQTRPRIPLERQTRTRRAVTFFQTSPPVFTTLRSQRKVFGKQK